MYIWYSNDIPHLNKMASRPIAMHEVCPFDVMSNGHFSLNSSNRNGNHCKYFRLPSSCVRSCLLLLSALWLLFLCSSHFPLAWHGSHLKKKTVDAIKWRRFATCMQITLAHSTQIKFAASCSTKTRTNFPSRAPLSFDSRQRLAKAKV